MRLKAGDVMPSFRAKTWDGADVTSEMLAGKRAWLAFYRFATCPFCNLRMHEVKNAAPDLQKSGLMMVGVLPSKPAAVGDAVQRHAIGYPMVCDPEATMYDSFGVGTSALIPLHPANVVGVVRAIAAGTFGTIATPPDASPMRVPADFLIRPDGKIETAFYGKSMPEHISLAAVTAFAKGA